MKTLEIARMKTPAMLKIARILSVVDTRVYEEGPDDRFHPVPGSGIESECARCGRPHEVHATVELRNGSVAVVGTGCMARDSLVPETAKRIRSADRAAKALRRLEAELAAAERRHRAYLEALTEVDAMEPPPVERTTVTVKVGRRKGSQVPAMRCGETVVWCREDDSEAELRLRERDVVNLWHGDQIRARAPHAVAPERLRARVEKARARLAELTEGQP